MHLFHKWTAKKAEASLYRHGWETVVLYRCDKCPKTKTNTYEGPWDLGDFT